MIRRKTGAGPGKPISRPFNTKAILAVPMLVKDKSWASWNHHRADGSPFTDLDVTVLETFAVQRRSP